MTAISFSAVIRKYSAKGEKSGWTFLEIPDDLIKKLRLPNKKGFRIRGIIDDVGFEKLSTYPVGEGKFIIALNTELKRKLGKKEGAMVSIKFEKDNGEPLKSKELLQALEEDPVALKQFRSLAPSHQNYFHRYIESAKTAPTKAGRIVHTINAMHRKMDFGEMIRGLKRVAR